VRNAAEILLKFAHDLGNSSYDFGGCGSDGGIHSSDLICALRTRRIMDQEVGWEIPNIFPRARVGGGFLPLSSVMSVSHLLIEIRLSCMTVPVRKLNWFPV
jgi:hypothetical protein